MSAIGNIRALMNSGTPCRTKMPRPVSPITGSQQERAAGFALAVVGQLEDDRVQAGPVQIRGKFLGLVGIRVGHEFRFMVAHQDHYLAAGLHRGVPQRPDELDRSQ